MAFSSTDPSGIGMSNSIFTAIPLYRLMNMVDALASEFRPFHKLQQAHRNPLETESPESRPFPDHAENCRWREGRAF